MNSSNATAATGCRSDHAYPTAEPSGSSHTLFVAKTTLCGSPAGALRVDKRLGAGAAAFVRDDDGGVDQLVLLNDRLHRARELIAAAAGPRGNDELNRTRGLPRAVACGT